MHWENKTFVWLAFTWYFLSCCGLELNPHYHQGGLDCEPQKSRDFFSVLLINSQGLERTAHESLEILLKKKKRKSVMHAGWINQQQSSRLKGDRWIIEILTIYEHKHWTRSPELEVVFWPQGHSLCDLKPHLPLQALDYPPSSWLHPWVPIWFQWE